MHLELSFPIILHAPFNSSLHHLQFFRMCSLHLNSYGLSSSSSPSQAFKFKHTPPPSFTLNSKRITNFKIKAIGTVPEKGSSEATSTNSPSSDQAPPSVDFAFVSSVLLPDGTPDVHLRSTCGGQDLRSIMLDNQIELYGPYARPLLNCAGGGTCGTCIVEVIEGKGMLTPKTDKEKAILRKKPKNWRLACQTTVGSADSRGLVVIQQLPEWKAHEWKFEKKEVPLESDGS